ncbi:MULTISPECIES: hypothetical protein [Streptomyces]|uniref:Uncharacterized protein n=1 Tax=Streptomyces chartreusis NRRL 3882 TaxID=1079985 RepID=A0A2N9BGS4_STRCX|nr:MULTISPECIES: hypothetical protein [Streptomyces]MYS88193.1 hypothetical protein [Streptomyces sp. SID5464]SOR82564.1 hypothetical protein SCNRRL3882_6014 [Streptomyces chartreusis NRRL 3882]
MGIRTFLRRRAPGVAPPPVPPFAAAASTVRVPATLTAVLRHTTAGLRRRLADRWRPADPTRAAEVPAATGRTGAVDVTAVPGLTGAGDVSAVLGHTGGTAPAVRHPGGADRAGRTGRPWADLARSYLTLVLTLLPRPRPAHTTITVYITTTEPLSERPTGSAPRHRRGQDRPGPGPEPDATP